LDCQPAKGRTVLVKKKKKRSEKGGKKKQSKRVEKRCLGGVGAGSNNRRRTIREGARGGGRGVVRKKTQTVVHHSGRGGEQNMQPGQHSLLTSRKKMTGLFGKNKKPGEGNADEHEKKGKNIHKTGLGITCGGKRDTERNPEKGVKRKV